MKNFFRLLRLLWTLKRRERDAQIQRFEILETHLMHCRCDADLEEYDAMERLTLRRKDYIKPRFYWLQVSRGEKERMINGCVVREQNSRINEADLLLSKYK